MAILKGEGTKLYYGESAAETLLGQRTSITGPSSSVGVVTTTNLDSTMQEYRAGLFDAGTVTCEYEYDSEDTGHKAMESAIAAGTIYKWALEFSNGAKRTFDGLINAHEISGMTVEGNVLASITIQLTTGITAVAKPGGA